MSLSNEEIVAEVKATEEEIFKVIQVKPKYIRVPYGEIDERIRGILTALGYEIVFWNLDTQDWQLENKEYTQDENQLLEKFRNISHNSTNSSGFISLQHEFLPITSQSLPKIHQILQNKKFDLVSLDQCLGNTPLEIPSEVQEAKPMEDITGSTEEVPFEEIPAQDTPTRESSAQDTPTGESSVQGTPTEENSQDTPIEENSAQENKTEEDSDYEEPTEMINVNSSEEFEITKIPTFIDDLSERQYLISNYGSVITPKAVILKVTFGVLIWILIN
ncbi:chitin deacetylase [Basidiobolus ranarum]|uniref:Chitin deacetylase n=1 Tax=Basidiobolus ranarum TaxID=34480 RepID=A0ABR2WLM2_9FUNG